MKRVLGVCVFFVGVCVSLSAILMSYDFGKNCVVNSDDKSKNKSLFVGHKKEILGDHQKEILTVSHRKP